MVCSVYAYAWLCVVHTYARCVVCMYACTVCVVLRAYPWCVWFVRMHSVCGLCVCMVCVVCAYAWCVWCVRMHGVCGMCVCMVSVGMCVYMVFFGTCTYAWCA